MRYHRSIFTFLLLATALLDARVQATQLNAMVRMEEFGAQMVDTFDAVRTIKIFSAEAHYRALLEERLEALARARRDNRRAMALPTAWSWLATSLITAAILWYGSHRVLTGQMTAGDLLVLFGMIAFYLTPVQRFPATMQPFVQALPLTALNDALRGVMLEGTGLAPLLPELALLAAWGTVSFLLAVKFFRWQ